jgi:hypothetical protein
VKHVRSKVVAAHGEPDPASGPRQRWKTSERYLLLVDPSNQICGGLCLGVLWIGGREHPELAPRGFVASR